MAAPTTPSLTINWHEYPFVRLLLPLFLGVLIAEKVTINNWIVGIVFSSAITMVMLLSLQKNTGTKLFGAAVVVSLLSFAHLRIYQHNEMNRVDHFSQVYEEGDVIIGQVSNMPEEKSKVLFNLKVTQVNDLSASGNIQVRVDKDDLSQQLSYGDVLRIDAHLWKSAPPKNPNSLDYSNYLHYQNIHHQFSLKKSEWQKIDSNQGWFLLRKVYDIRKTMLQILRTHLPSEDLFAIGASLTLGYRGALNNEIREAYADTGAIHILAVSGLHVGIIAMILFWILKVLPAYTLGQKWLKAGIALVGIWLFALLTGASASVIRAATMFSFIIIGKYVKRNGNIYNSLAMAAFCSLIYDPYLLFQVGFQLSYLAVSGIVFFQPKIYRLIYIKYKLIDYLWQITTVSIAAQIAVFPISLYYFHQFPIYFWLSSMIVIPAAFVILLLAIFLFASQLLLPVMSEVGGEVLEWLIYIMNEIIFAIKRLPYGLIDGVWIEWYDIFLWYGFIVTATLVLLYRKAKFAIAFLMVVCLLLGSYTAKKIDWYFNKSLVVYHSSRETIIDFFDDRQTYTLHHPNLEEKTLANATEQHREAMGSKSVQTHLLSDTISTTYDHLWMKLPYIQFHDQRIMLLDHERLLPSDQRLEVDYLLIHNNPRINIVEVLRTVTPQIIVFDASNDFSRIKKWEIECEELGVPYYNVREKGAFKLDL